MIDTTEMYLRADLELEEGVPALRERTVQRLGHAGPTVSVSLSADRAVWFLPRTGGDEIVGSQTD